MNAQRPGARGAVASTLLLATLALVLLFCWGLAAGARPAAAAEVLMNVDYSADRLAGFYEAGHTFALTVTDSTAAVKATAVVQTEAGGDGGFFFTEDGDWSPGKPDIQPGDIVSFAGDDGYTSTVPVGLINALFDPAANTVVGEIVAPALAGQMVLGEAGRSDLGYTTFTTTVDLEGVGPFGVEFAGEWPDDEGMNVAYWHSPEARVSIFLEPPAARMDVNFSADWVRGAYEAGHTFTVTASNAAALVKAVALVQSTASGNGPPLFEPGFLTEAADWSPAPPDIQPGDWVTVAGDDGYDRLIRVGAISAALDPTKDIVVGQIVAPWLAGQMVTGDAGAWALTFGSYTTTLNAAGSGAFLVNFAPFDWPPNQGLSVSYQAGPDSYIFMDVPPPAGMGDFHVNYLADRVWAEAAAGHAVTLTVAEAEGSPVKATMQLLSDSSGFDSGDGTWVPGPPDIGQGDWVTVTVDTGYTLDVQVGEIQGRVDVPQNRVTGTVNAPWLLHEITVGCAPRMAAGIVVHSEPFVPANEETFTCAWDPATEWELEAGVKIGLWYCVVGACVETELTVPAAEGWLYLPLLVR